MILNFLGLGEPSCFRTILCLLSLDQSDGPMFHPVLLSCLEKIVARLASDKEGQCKHRHDFACVRLLTL